MSKSNSSVQLNDEQFNEMFNVSLLQPTNKVGVVLNEEQNNIVKSTNNVSTKIRMLLATNLKRSEVAKVLGVRYQHVRNVELTPLKKG